MPVIIFQPLPIGLLPVPGPQPSKRLQVKNSQARTTRVFRESATTVLDSLSFHPDAIATERNLSMAVVVDRICSLSSNLTHILWSPRWITRTRTFPYLSKSSTRVPSWWRRPRKKRRRRLPSSKSRISLSVRRGPLLLKKSYRTHPLWPILTPIKSR